MNPTGGQWTSEAGYDPNTKDLTIRFNSGFQAVYPNVSPAKASEILSGATTKDGRPNSVGAALHRSGIMHDYN